MLLTIVNTRLKKIEMDWKLNKYHREVQEKPIMM